MPIEHLDFYDCFDKVIAPLLNAIFGHVKSVSIDNSINL